MQARFYLPIYGRFASPDPARDQHFEDTQSWNIYSYVQNNPVMSIDPTGMVDNPFQEQLTRSRIVDGKQSSETISIKGHNLDALGIKVYETVGKPGSFSDGVLSAGRGDVSFALDAKGSFSQNGSPSFTGSLDKLVAWDQQLSGKKFDAAIGCTLSASADVATLGLAGSAERGLAGAFKWVAGLFAPKVQNPIGIANTVNGVATGDKSTPGKALLSTAMSIAPIVGTLKGVSDADKLNNHGVELVKEKPKNIKEQ